MTGLPGEERPAGINLQPLFAPRSIAIIGASDKPGKRGHELLANLRANGFPGAIYPINPRLTELDGMRCYASVLDVPGQIEAAAIALPAQAAVEAVRQCAAQGVRAAIVVAAGFAEAGSAGQVWQAELLDCARQNNLLLAGPNCLGTWDLRARCCYWVSSPRLGPPSRVAGVLQSGALVSALADPAAERGLLFSAMATVGNQAMLTAGDYLDYLVRDPEINGVAVVLEEIRRPQAFLAALDVAAELGKPVVVLKLGRTAGGRQAALAHTASLAGESAVVDAALRQYGAILVDDLDELLETLVLVEAGRLPQGNRCVAVAVSGAGCGLVADLAEQAGLQLPPLSVESLATLQQHLPDQLLGNPVDIARAGDEPGLYHTCFAALGADPDIDTLVVVQNTPWGRSPEATAFYADHATVAAAAQRDHPDKLVCAISLTSGAFDPDVAAIYRDGGVPLLQGTREGLRAISTLTDYAAWQRQRHLADPRSDIVFSATMSNLQAARHLLSTQESASKATAPLTLPYSAAATLMELYSIPLATAKLARTADEAASIAERFHGPLALKIISANVPHKTDHGLVTLNIATPDAARSATQTLLDRASQIANEQDIEGVLVQEMVSDSPELIAGISRDEQFGPVVVLGWGGQFVEAQRAFTLGLPPITLTVAHRMISALPYQTALNGYRGLAAVDRDALAGLLIRLGALAGDLGDIIEAIDLNPLMSRGSDQGVVAVDLLVTTKRRVDNI